MSHHTPGRWINSAHKDLTLRAAWEAYEQESVCEQAEPNNE
jgi:hypothetical protein